MIIRNANIIDIEKIANLYVTNWKNTYSELLPQDFLDSLTVNSAIYKWSNYLNSENNNAFPTNYSEIQELYKNKGYPGIQILNNYHETEKVSNTETEKSE